MQLFGSATPPRDEFVLSQGFVRDVEMCRGLLPDHRMWPRELDGPTVEERRLRIDRRMIFDIAERVASDIGDPWAASQLHAAIVFWGAPPGQSATRAARALADPNAPKLLTDAFKELRAAGPKSAYNALSRGGRLWIRGLGPSYFTKFLYFAGYGAKQRMSKPLIMDDNVIAALTQLTHQQWIASADDYVRYLDFAADCAYELQTDPDVIERRLFQLGE